MTITTVRFDTGGMHCPSCPMLIEIAVEELEGVLEVSADARTLITEVTYDSALLSEVEIVQAMEEVGYTAVARVT